MSLEDGKITEDQLLQLASLAAQLAPFPSHTTAWEKFGAGLAGSGISAIALIVLGVTNPVGWLVGAAAAVGISFGLIEADEALEAAGLMNYTRGGKSNFINKSFYEIITVFLASSEDTPGRDYTLANNLITAAESYILSDKLVTTDDGTGFVPFQPVHAIPELIEEVEKYGDDPAKSSTYVISLAVQLARKKKDLLFAQQVNNFNWTEVKDANSDRKGFHIGKVGVSITQNDYRKIIIDKLIEVIDNKDLRSLSENDLAATIIQNNYDFDSFNAKISEVVSDEFTSLKEREIELHSTDEEKSFDYRLMPVIDGDKVTIDASITSNGYDAKKLISEEDQEQGASIALLGDPNDESTTLGSVFKETINFPSDMANDDEEESDLRDFEGFQGKKVYTYEFKALNFIQTLADVPWYVAMFGPLPVILWTALFAGKKEVHPSIVLEFAVKQSYYKFIADILDDSEDGNLSQTIGTYFENRTNDQEMIDLILDYIIIDKEIVRRIEFFKNLVKLTEDGDLTDDEKDKAEKAGLDAFLKGDFGEEAEDLSKEDIENRQKFFKQCALMMNMPKLSNLFKSEIKRRYGTRAPFGARFLTAYCGGEGSSQETLVSKLVSSKEEQTLFDLKPYQVSQLVPKIRLFKVYEGGKSGLKEVEFFFDRTAVIDRPSVEFQGKTIEKQTKFLSESYDKGAGVGLKEFSFEFNGTNPAEARNDIKATLKLFFQSFADFVRHRESDNGIYRFVDLVIQPTREDNAPFGVVLEDGRHYDPRFYRIRSEVGYHIPPDASEELKKALQASNKSFFLTMVDHDINFNKDGSVQISITYRAYMESLFKHPKLDALASPELIEVREANSRTLKEQIQKRECSKEQIKELQVSLLAQEEVILKKSLMSIIERLTERGVIYHGLINQSHKDFFKTNGFFRRCSLEFGFSATEDDTSVETVLNSELPENSDEFNFLDSDSRGVSFFYFGDLLYTILDCIYDENDNYRVGLENNKIILGSFEFEPFQEVTFANKVFNIAELPISVDFFSRWFVDNITSQKDTRTSFPVLKFIRNLSDSLVRQSLVENCVNGEVSKTLRFQTGQLTAFDSKSEPLEKLAISSMNRGDVSINVDHYRAKGSLPLDGGGADDTTRVKDYYNYILLASIGSSLSKAGTGDFSKDKDDGRFHVHIGQDSGLVKSISLSKTDQQYIREARFFQNGIDGLLQLSAVYVATLEMFGNTIFYPGMEFFFNPYGLGGTMLGRPQDKNSIANKLGIGGYHTVISVKSTITPGKFTTTVQGRQYFSGAPEDKDGTTIEKIKKSMSIGNYSPDKEDAKACNDVILEVQNFRFESDKEPETEILISDGNIEEPTSGASTTSTAPTNDPTTIVENTKTKGGAGYSAGPGYLPLQGKQIAGEFIDEGSKNKLTFRPDDPNDLKGLEFILVDKAVEE